MTGITLMVIGVLIFIIGIITFYFLHKKKKVVDNENKLEKTIKNAIVNGVLTNNEKNRIKRLSIKKGLDYNQTIKDIENSISKLDPESKTQAIDNNQRKGYNFEKFIVRKFNKKFFTVKEWAGNKDENEICAETTLQPDILVEFEFKQKTYKFAVECKWRRYYSNNVVEFATQEEMERFKQFQKDKNIPVFIAIGIGGKGISPKQLYVVPLQKIINHFIHIKELKKYEMKINSNFFFDVENNILK